MTLAAGRMQVFSRQTEKVLYLGTIAYSAPLSFHKGQYEGWVGQDHPGGSGETAAQDGSTERIIGGGTYTVEPKRRHCHTGYIRGKNINWYK